MDVVKTVSGREIHSLEGGYYSIRGSVTAAYSAENTRRIKNLLMAHSDEIDKAAEEELKQHADGITPE